MRAQCGRYGAWHPVTLKSREGEGSLDCGGDFRDGDVSGFSRDWRVHLTGLDPGVRWRACLWVSGLA